MATLKYGSDGALISSKYVNKLKAVPGVGVIEIVFDCSKTYSATAGSYAAIGSTDVIELFSVPAGMKVMDAAVTILTAGTTSCTLALGDAAGGAAGFLAAAAMDAAAGTQYGTAAAAALGLAAAGGKLYTPALVDTVDITFAGAAPGSLVVRIELLVWQSNVSASINTMY